MISKDTLLSIKRIALKIDHDVAFAGKSKGNRHLFRVVKLAKQIAKRLHANVSIVEAGAWLHDTALPSGDDYSYEKNKKIVKDILAGLNPSKEESNMIAECVASHEGTSRPKILEAKIVHDADVLEKSGVLGVIRHTWKLVNSGKMTPNDVTEKEARAILRHLKWRGRKLQTALGKKIHSYLSVPVTVAQSKKIISIVAEKAVKGTVTEKIAPFLHENLTRKQSQRLKEQLNLAYLDKF